MIPRDLKELKPGAVYALEVDARLSRDQARAIQEEWTAHAPKDARLLVLDGGMTVSEVSEEKLREWGLIP